MKKKKTWNVNPRSLKNLNPANRLKSKLPKKRVNLSIDNNVYLSLKATGNLSGHVEQLVVKSEVINYIIEDLERIIENVNLSEPSYKEKSARKLIADLIKLGDKIDHFMS